MRKVLKKIVKRAIVFLLSLIGLLLLAWIAIQQPKVQQQLADFISRKISEKLDVPFRVGNVNIRFFRRLLLEDVYLEDQQKDTLLAIGQLEGRLSLFSILGREVDITLVGLDRTFINLKRNAQDSSFNYQFLVDAFASDNTTPPDTLAVPWRIGLGDLKITDFRLVLNDSLESQYAAINLQDLFLEVDTFDLPGKIMTLQKLSIDKSSWHYMHRPDTSRVGSTPIDTMDLNLAFCQYPFPTLIG